MRAPFRRPRFLLALLAAALLLPGTLPSEASADETPGVTRLDRLLDAARARIDDLVKKASADPRKHKIELYQSYTIEDFKRRRREVEAEDLIGWIFTEETLHIDLRMQAIEALKRQLLFDPDLLLEKRGSQSPRARLTSKKIVPFLRTGRGTADNIGLMQRKLALETLKKLWGQPNDPAIGNYRSSHKNTWGPAVSAWQKWLKKR